MYDAKIHRQNANLFPALVYVAVTSSSSLVVVCLIGEKGSWCIGEEGCNVLDGGIDRRRIAFRCSVGETGLVSLCECSSATSCGRNSSMLLAVHTLEADEICPSSLSEALNLNVGVTMLGEMCGPNFKSTLPSQVVQII